MYNSTNLQDEVFQRIVADALKAHQNEIDAIHALIQNNKTAVVQIMATGRFNLASLQAITDALLTHLEDEIISATYIEPALKAARSRRKAKPSSPQTNSTASTRYLQSKPTPHPAMGFRPHARKE